METIKGKAALLGQRIGIRYADGFISQKTPAIKASMLLFRCLRS